MAEDKGKKKQKRGSIAAIAMDPKLMRAMLHPTRVKIVAEINKPGCLLSPRKFSDKEDDISLSNASYRRRLRTNKRSSLCGNCSRAPTSWL